MKELEHEADLLAAQLRQLVFAEPGDVHAVDQTEPDVGASSPASSPSSVDLPLPDGPTIATNWPRGIVVDQRMKDGERLGAARDRLRDLAQLDHDVCPSAIGRSTGHTLSATMRAPSAVG